jgi:hypothetical protein
MEKEVGEVMWTVLCSNFGRRTGYPGFFVHFLNLLQADAWILSGFGHDHFIQKCHLIIIFDAVYVFQDAVSVA